MTLAEMLDRPIAFQRAFVSLGAGITGALMLSQAVYWSNRTSGDDGWFYKSQAEWESETGLTRTEQERARRGLKSIGVLEEKYVGLPAKLYYRVNLDVLAASLGRGARPVSLDEVLSTHQAALKKLSRAGYMRAVRAGVEAEKVDYADVLRTHGMVCGCCGKAITRGPGKTPESLAFDHKHPIAKGGPHTAENLRPTHAACNGRKGDAAPDIQPASAEQPRMLIASNQGCLQQASLDVCDKQAGVLTASKQECLQQATILTETTTETTAEIISEGAPPPSAGRLVDAAPPKRKRQAKPKDEAEEERQAACRAIWSAYSQAYLDRYETTPVRNQKVNSQVDGLRTRLGHEAPAVAEFFVWINDAYLLRNCHNFGLLLANAEGYRTQWATGRQVNGTTAKQIENTQANINAAQQAAANIRAGGSSNAFLRPNR